MAPELHGSLATLPSETELHGSLKLSCKALLKLSYMALELHGSLATLPSETELHGSLKLSYMAP